MEMPTCSGTGCKSPSIGKWFELKEVPAWRHPEDELGDCKFDLVKEVYYCADHEKAAKSINLSTRSLVLEALRGID